MKSHSLDFIGVTVVRPAFAVPFKSKGADQQVIGKLKVAFPELNSFMLIPMEDFLS